MRALDQGQHAQAGGRVHRGYHCAARKRMGHAGAIISGGQGGANEKLAVMEECGIHITRNPAEMGRLMQKVLKG